MKDKFLPDDINSKTLDELKYQANKIIEKLESEKNLDELAEDYKKLIKFVKDRPGHDFRYALNSAKLKKDLKWKPSTSINVGLEKTFNWYLLNRKSKTV